MLLSYNTFDKTNVFVDKYYSVMIKKRYDVFL